MSKLLTLTVFSNSFDVKFNLLKDMLSEANIPFVATNEFNRSVKAEIFPPSNMGIEVKIDEEYVGGALAILKSIE